MKVALYARVSTDGQDPANQILRLREVAKSRGYEEYTTYIDIASGACQRRPALDNMLKAAKAKSFDKILCTKIDRLARSMTNLLTIMENLENWHVGVEFLDQPIDTITSSGKLVLSILGALAEFERELIRDRTNDGLQRAAREGRKGGRPRTELSEYQIRKARELKAKNPQMSNEELARNFQGISRPVLIRLLKERGVIQ